MVNDDVSLSWLARVMLRERRLILAFAAAGMLLSLAVPLLRARTWSTTFSFLPQDNESQGAAGLAGLASQFGLSLGALGVGGEQPPELYVDLLTTREVLTPIATDSFAAAADDASRVPLAELLDIDEDRAPVRLEKTIKLLRTKVVSAGVANRSTGMVSVRVRTTSPAASHEIAQRLLTGLNAFNLVTRQSTARAERVFTEGRMEEARQALRAAEGSLQRFLETNRVLSNSPSLTFDRDRLQREVTLRQQVFTALVQQFEQARLKEVRDTPVLSLVEAPVPAARPDSRKLSLWLAAGTLVATFLGVLVALGRQRTIRGVE